MIHDYGGISSGLHPEDQTDQHSVDFEEDRRVPATDLYTHHYLLLKEFTAGMNLARVICWVC